MASLTSIVTEIVLFLNELPVVRSIPASVKKVLGDVLSVAVVIVSVLAVAVGFGVNLHLPATDLGYLTAAASVGTALVAALRREIGAQVAAKLAAKDATPGQVV